MFWWTKRMASWMKIHSYNFMIEKGWVLGWGRLFMTVFCFEVVVVYSDVV
jgi:hypothetical protein